jgi:hypothetical protein
MLAIQPGASLRELFRRYGISAPFGYKCPSAARERRRRPFMPAWILNGAVVSGCRQPTVTNPLTVSQLLIIVFRTDAVSYKVRGLWGIWSRRVQL